MGRITIRPARPSSLPALNRLFVHAVKTNFDYFPGSVQERVIREHSLGKLVLAAIHPRRILLVARDGRQVVGYAIGNVPAGGHGQLFWLYVSPDRRGENIGLSLLSRALKLQAAKGAREVAIATHDHRKYYERQGFKYVATKTVNGVKMDVMTYRFF